MTGNALRPILSIEDSDEDFYSLCMALRYAGVANPVQRCADSRTACALLDTEAGCAKVREAAFILLDLNMPGMDGRELLTLFRKRGPAIPVIVLSTSSHPSDVDFCYKAGANAYLVKPLEFDRWEQMIGILARHWLDTVILPNNDRQI